MPRPYFKSLIAGSLTSLSFLAVNIYTQEARAADNANASTSQAEQAVINYYNSNEQQVTEFMQLLAKGKNLLARIANNREVTITQVLYNYPTVFVYSFANQAKVVQGKYQNHKLEEFGKFVSLCNNLYQTART
ncbi:hypothetical protein [Psittacicella hinzii]|uniref:Uncharacterized protein n=1 Tax=Psittacicella hinzii TaxID=2028575 RepID=A0A3A1YKV2_9GAMM|nr:hypothetical protein [Psittacicella hinzii]RIY37848.1 hypothetical protein CKF58_04605 [Psittacicella hinzii]